MSEAKFTKGEWEAHVGIMDPDFVYIGEEHIFSTKEAAVAAAKKWLKEVEE